MRGKPWAVPLRAVLLAVVGAAALAAFVSADGRSEKPAPWPTTCVGLNDAIEMSQGNHRNVGIYQREFGDQAEQACRNEHRGDLSALGSLVADADAAASDGQDADAMAADGQDADEQQGMQSPPAAMTKLTDGVYQYIGFGYVSLVVISGGEVLITDPSFDLRAQALKEAIAELTDAPVSTIVLTHEHYDHAGGTSVFADASVICHVNCQPIFDLFTSPTGDVPEVDQTFQDLLRIDVGGIDVELHHLGPGDGEATTIIYLPEEQIVVTSDLYEPRGLTGGAFVDDKNFTGVRHILNTISQWPLKHAVNAHSLGTDPIDLYENVEYYNDLYDAVYEELAAAVAQSGPFGAFMLQGTLSQTLKLPKYQDWSNYDTAFPRHVDRMLLSIFHGD